MTLSGRTIARLVRPFEGGGGPSHNTVENIFLTEDADAYLPEAGNKAERVRGGLKALKDGRRSGPLGPELPPDHTKLRAISEDLAERLVASGQADEDDLAEVFGGGPTAAPAAPPTLVQQQPGVTMREPNSAPIFVVHGHDTSLLYQAVRVLEKGTSRDVIVLHEQASAGRTVLEKFEDHAANVSYAVVLLTPDDLGGANGQPQHARARQNVIFELGFFFGRLGRRHVAVLLAPGVEQPSDIAGLVYIAVDSAGSWKYALARELQAAGVNVAMDQIP